MRQPIGFTSPQTQREPDPAVTAAGNELVHRVLDREAAGAQLVHAFYFFASPTLIAELPEPVATALALAQHAYGIGGPDRG